MDFTALSTPAVLVDRTRLVANIDRMQAAADARRVHLRPHAKTHKIPAIARWQLDRGAVGICCAKIGEAEVFAAAGIDDIRLPYPVNPRNASRLLALMDRPSTGSGKEGRCRISIIVDHPAVARGWSDAMQAARRSLDVLVKVDVGSHRCGIDPASASGLELLRLVSGLPGLRLRGLLSHQGHSYAADSEAALGAMAREEAAMMCGLADKARADGISIDEISVGATPTARFSVTQPGVTEVRPGTYAYFDRNQVAFGSACLQDCALTVLAMVVSKPARDRIVLDCGSKTLSNDPPHAFVNPRGFGAVLADLTATAFDEDLTIERLSEEHAVAIAASGSTHLEPGDLVRVLPNHVCQVSNLVDCVHLVEATEVVETLAVAARGKIA